MFRNYAPLLRYLSNNCTVSSLLDPFNDILKTAYCFIYYFDAFTDLEFSNFYNRTRDLQIRSNPLTYCATLIGDNIGKETTYMITPHVIVYSNEQYVTT